LRCRWLARPEADTRVVCPQAAIHASIREGFSRRRKVCGRVVGRGSENASSPQKFTTMACSSTRGATPRIRRSFRVLQQAYSPDIHQPAGRCAETDFGFCSGLSHLKRSITRPAYEQPVAVVAPPPVLGAAGSRESAVVRRAPLGGEVVCPWFCWRGPAAEPGCLAITSLCPGPGQWSWVTPPSAWWRLQRADCPSANRRTVGADRGCISHTPLYSHPLPPPLTALVGGAGCGPEQADPAAGTCPKPLWSCLD